MSLEELFVGDGATVREALERITKTGKGVVLVVDAERRLLGIATDGDLRKAILRGVGLDAPVDGAMNRSPLVAPPGIAAPAALVMMRSRSIRQLPIVADGRVVDVLFFDKLLEPPPLPNAAVIMAGGRGNRLSPLTETTPKPLLRIGGKPVLEIMVERLRSAGFREIVMTVHYLNHMIEEHFGDGRRFSVNIGYRREDEPRGTAGSLIELRNHFDRPFLLVNADILTKCDFREMLAFHERHHALMTVGTVPYTVDMPYGILEVDGERLAGVTEKPRFDFLINAGIYVVSPRAVELGVPPTGAIDMPDVIAKLMELKQHVVAFPIREYWLDIGRHPDLEKANRDVAEGLLE
jgi:dTDP-glucose pyrophosphorylase